jgi:uncharacterized membrane protein YedE/YeeE
MPLLSTPLPWYVSGPLIGLLVVGLYAVANQRLGVSGTYLQVANFFRDRPSAEMWRVWFFVGMLCGSFVAGLLQGGPTLSLAYGALGAVLPLALLAPVLFLGGVLIGFGARWAGGCTSGHAIAGTSSRSPASWAAALTFFVTAVAVTLIIHALTGGAL